MTVGIVDSTVIIHLLRNDTLAIAWVNSFATRLGVTSITWLEVMFGAPGKIGQGRAKAVLAKFDLYFPTREDQLWAMEMMERYRLSGIRAAASPAIPIAAMTPNTLSGWSSGW